MSGIAPRIAVLIATYNSAAYIADQLASLARNQSVFTLHWIDDGSTDATVRLVEEEARRYSLDLHRHVAGTKLGVPGAFFYLIEKVEADLYFFCDHDDIWEAGKIDATANVASLEVPAFYFSEPKLFTTEAPDELFRYFHHLGVSVDRALDARSAFFFNPAVGNTVAVNRELRNIYLHQATQARDGAAMHDWWFYLLAKAVGRVYFLRDSPTTLYRQHAGNVIGVRMTWWQRGVVQAWLRQKAYRRIVAKQAQAFLAIVDTLGAGASLEVMIQSAEIAAGCARRQSPKSLLRMMRNRSTPIGLVRSGFFLLGCFLSEA